MVFDEDTIWASIVAAMSSFWGYAVSIDWLVAFPAMLGVVYLVMKIIAVKYEIKKNKNRYNHYKNQNK